MQINATAIRTGNILEVDGALWRVTKSMHVTPGKGVACMQVEMRNVETGTKTNKRFNSTERVERVTLSQRPMQYLYEDGDLFHFMDTESYEQISLGRDMVEEALPYLMPEMQVEIEFHEDRPLNVRLPQTVVLTVVECDAAMKGQTASGSFKPAVLSNGVRTGVPTHVTTGTRIVVNTADGTYVERAKD